LRAAQYDRLADAERTLGTDYLVAYQPDGPASPLAGLQAAPLTASQ
jgi:hypothetical protein